MVPGMALSSFNTARSRRGEDSSSFLLSKIEIRFDGYDARLLYPRSGLTLFIAKIQTFDAD